MELAAHTVFGKGHPLQFIELHNILDMQRNDLIPLHFQDTVAQRKNRSYLIFSRQKFRNLPGRGYVFVKGNPDIAAGIHIGDPLIGHNNFWHQIPHTHFQQQLFFHGRHGIIDVGIDALHQHAALFIGKVTGILPGHAPGLPLFLQMDPTGVMIIIPDPEFGSGVITRLIFLQTGIVAVVKI